MEQFINQNLEVFGPYAVFALLMLSGIGLSLSEDLIIIPAGVLIGGGDMNFWSTLVAAYLGVVFSDCVWFTLCRRYGTPLLHRRWFKRMVHPRRLLEAKHEMERRGAWMVVVARFIPGSRTTTITVAGMLHMPFWKFATVTACCVCLTAPLQLGAGMLIAHGTSSYELTEQVQVIVAVFVLVFAVTFVINFIRKRRRTKTHSPRAKVRWLKRFRVPRPRRRKADADTTTRPQPER